jgi:hypothetical protein
VGEIEEIARRRGITVLVHFTQLENLGGILTHGLLPRTQYNVYGVAPLLADDVRLDYCLEASSLSIGFPNYKMFYKCRMEKPSSHWVVIAFKPSILWQKDCAFCVENAARSTVAAIPISDRKTAQAFESLFSEAESKPSRREMGLVDALPTNPQAEVLVFGRIEPEFVIGVAFDQQAVVDEYKARYPDVLMKRMQKLFQPRIDYPHWRRS